MGFKRIGLAVLSTGLLWGNTGTAVALKAAVSPQDVLVGRFVDYAGQQLRPNQRPGN
jgi:hypothetical protein